MTYSDRAAAIRADIAGLAADADQALDAANALHNSDSLAIDILKAQVASQETTIAALKAQLAAVTPPPVVVPPVVTPPPVTTAPVVPFAPPPGWQAYRTFPIPATGGTVTIPAGVDALLIAPPVITGPVTITGGRNRVLVGAVLGGRKTVPTGSYDSTNRGIRLSDGDDTGRDWIEGIRGEAGTYFSDFVQIALRTNANRDVDLVNLRNDGTTYGTQGTVHADVIQCWGGPRRLRVWGLTARNVTYQGLYLDAGDGRTLPAAQPGWTFQRINLLGVTGQCRYLFANRQPTYTKATAVDVWISGSPYNNADSFGNAPAGVNVGTVPDFVPASLWASGYVSPGYES